jgi:hypothetical protein
MTPPCRLARDLAVRERWAMSASRSQPPPGSGLQLCSLCHDDYVVPIWWEPVAEQQWHMLLRCAQCETYRDVVVTDDIAQRYEKDLARGMAEIATSLRQVDHDRMVAEADVFIAALDHDLIDAGDFANARRWMA